MEKLQFQVLYRNFLFRMVDLELLSADARGDSSKLFGQFASLLIFISIGLAVLAIGLSGRMTPLQRLNFSWAMEHFLIATTMLVVGLFAVLSWDSTYPDRRDVMVLAPLPVRVRTLFLAKVAGVAAALGLVVLMLHGIAGLVWPVALSASTPPQTIPALSSDPAIAPVDAASMQSVLDRDIAPALRPGGALAPGTGTGAAIGVWSHGVRRVFAYGAVQPDSIFEIASISKTFTALILAQMAAQGKVRLNEPVRDLLPPGMVARPAGAEITLLDLATHRSGLPRTVRDIRADGNRDLDYSPEELFAYMAQRGVRKTNAPFEYSNLGFALLGQALANRADLPYAELVRQTITGPLGLRDTVLKLDATQTARFVQGHTNDGRPVPSWEFDAQAPAGGIRSTAGDLLTYLEANLHPERFAEGALTDAVRATHRLRHTIPFPIASETGLRIGLAWMRGATTGVYFHPGDANGQTSWMFFHPRHDYAAVVLVNVGPGLVELSQLLAEHIRQRFAGEPAVALAPLTVPATGGILAFPRRFAAYWFVMLASGAFLFGGVLLVQGLSALLLPRRLLLRVSSFLQMAVLCLVLCVYFLQPLFASADALTRAQGTGLLSWSPSYWFLGLFQQLSGAPIFPTLAHRAWLGLAAIGFGTASVYALSYVRTLRKIVEEPDIVPGIRTAGWLPRFGTPRQTALVQFAARTLLRSRQHRVLLAFYLGLGFAIMIFLLSAPATQDMMSNLQNPWRQVNLPMLASSIVILCAWVMGTRVVFSMPIDLRANWIFRITPVQGGRECTVARRRALLLLSVAPVCVAAAALFLTLWPLTAASGTILVLALLGTVLAEISLAGAQKIPFTCSYLPGKSQVHMRFWFCFAVLTQLLNRASELMRNALQSFTTYAVVAGVLAIVAIALRRRTASWTEEKLQFEDADTPAVQQLGLYRDGVLPIEPLSD